MMRSVCKVVVTVAAVLLIGAAPTFTISTSTAPVVQQAGGDVPSGG